MSAASERQENLIRAEGAAREPESCKPAAADSAELPVVEYRLDTKYFHSCTKALVVRLTPGQDLLAEILKVVEAHRIRAGTVQACVGSLQKCVLRPAGSKGQFVKEEALEIISLSGTLSAKSTSAGTGGHHLHMSVSDANCAVFGGHVLPGYVRLCE